MPKRFGLALPLFLAACATAAPPAAGPEALRGCWIERRADGDTDTMRWFPDGGAWRGEAQRYRAPGFVSSAAILLAPRAGGWRICAVVAGEPMDDSCEPALFGRPELAPSEPWTEIEASAERLKITARAPGEQASPIIDAARDGCD